MTRASKHTVGCVEEEMGWKCDTQTNG